MVHQFDIMTANTLLCIVTGLLFLGLSIPLIWQQVPPNRWYGFRVSKTFSDEAIWYSVNRVAGYDLLLAGGTITLTALVMQFLSQELFYSSGEAINLAVLLSSLAAAILHSFVVLRKL